MKRMVTFGALAVFVAVSFGLTACKPEEVAIDPKILEYLKTPCAGSVDSVFHESASGWGLTVSCTDPEKAKAEARKILESAGGKVEPSGNADKLMSFE